MVNGNYILYGDRPSSESEIVDDHVQTKTAERKTRRKVNRTANELQSTLNLAQLDNETDSIKYEKRIKEPRLLRYVPTTDVEENFVSEKFETYDLKPTEDRPRRYAFTKKPKNPTDGSVNYAYSRSSSSCSSPNGNLPTISEHAEQYGSYRVRPASTPVVNDLMTGYESKLDKYFTKPRDVKPFTAKGSHPDSLYRVASAGVGSGKMARALRILRWPAALLLVCVALAAFVYFLMPDNISTDNDRGNASNWDPVAAGAGAQSRKNPPKPHENPELTKAKETTSIQGTRTSEIDFYDADTDKTFDISVINPAKDTGPQKNIPIQPVFPEHITPEVQYGNEKADTNKLRTPKILDEMNKLLEESTLKPHITQKPEKPLEIYFRDGNGITTTLATETIAKAETLNEYINYGEKYSSKKIEEPKIKPHVPLYKEYNVPQPNRVNTVPQVYERGPEIPSEIQEFYQRKPENVDLNFTSGHSKVFGLSIEDAQKMRSTTQSSTYNTRVSPTLPTWRDGDDTTTKKYPVNVNYDVPQCRSTRLTLCRGVLPYDLAGPAVTVNGVEITALLSQIEYLVATNCSDRVQHFVCSLMEPECNPPPFPVTRPCYNLCKAISDSCEGLVPRELLPIFNCNQYSSANCFAAKTPCFPREMACGDGSCVPRDWICDGTNDCPAGEDEAKCVVCQPNEFKCPTGGCILKRWLCDGYADCAGGEDEAPGVCAAQAREPEHQDEHAAHSALGGYDHSGHAVQDGYEHTGHAEHAAGSAPAPAVRPYRVSAGKHARDRTAGENDSSKEILVTSDSNNGFKRNYTRRPSLSRLTPYSRPMLQDQRSMSNKGALRSKEETLETTQMPLMASRINDQKYKSESGEDVVVSDFFDEIDKNTDATERKRPEVVPAAPAGYERVPPPPQDRDLTRLDKSLNKLEKVIDGAALLKKATAQQDAPDSPESNSTVVEREEDMMQDQGAAPGSMSAHASPCPSGELRCVDGRCITLAQLCDGTIDCSDHADEDNCYT